MKRKTVRKLWQGKFVSIRDYEISSAIKLGGLVIEYAGKYMELSVEDLASITPKGQAHQSQFGGTYQLADITWQPLVTDPRQPKLKGIDQ
jgi:hypothetical protein|tara:strand:- start:3416 stop:3685 length:270 start_codon:yes stop_codon:yes gene_type:complete